MSKISIESNSAGSGTFTLVSPGTNTNRTLTLPDTDGALITASDIPAGYDDQDALNLFNVTGSAPTYACRAWAKWGTDDVQGGGSVILRDSGNVSSITVNGTGQYTVNFTVDLPTEHYASITAGTGWYTGGGHLTHDELDHSAGINGGTIDRVSLRSVQNDGSSGANHAWMTIAVFC